MIWRLFSLAGGGLLAATFFMPAIEGCSEPVVPFEMTMEYGKDITRDLRDPTSSFPWSQFIFVFYVLVAAYLFGLLAAMSAVSRLRRGMRIPVFPGILILFFVFILAGGLCTLTGIAIWRNGITMILQLDNSDPFLGWYPLVTIVGLPLLLMILLIRSVLRRQPGNLSIIFVLGIFAVYWFSRFYFLSLLDDNDYYGIHLSFAASLMIVVSTFGEARVMDQRSWWRVLLGLMIGNAPKEHRRAGICPQCGYYLYGLTEQRCPECGRAFTFEELESTPEALGFHFAQSETAD